MDYNEYWLNNTFELYNRIKAIKQLLKIHKAETDYVRIGSKNDGGYILANDIKETDYVISFGVDNNIDFENELSDLGCRVDMYDYSITVPPENIRESARFFNKKIVGDFGTSGINTFETNLSQCIYQIENDIILKIDIEGSEWDVLSTSKNLNKFRQIVFEAHWMQNLIDPIFYNKVLNALINIRQTHIPVWVHANNNVPLLILGNSPVPTVFEVLFLRKESYNYTLVENKELDVLTNRNDINFPEIELSFP